MILLVVQSPLFFLATHDATIELFYLQRVDSLLFVLFICICCVLQHCYWFYLWYYRTFVRVRCRRLTWWWCLRGRSIVEPSLVSLPFALMSSFDVSPLPKHSFRTFPARAAAQQHQNKLECFYDVEEERKAVKWRCMIGLCECAISRPDLQLKRSSDRSYTKTSW